MLENNYLPEIFKNEIEIQSIRENVSDFLNYRKNELNLTLSNIEKLLIVSESNYNEVNNQGWFTRIWKTVSGKNKKLEIITSRNLQEIQRLSLAFLQELAMRDTVCFNLVHETIIRLESVKIDTKKIKEYLVLLNSFLQKKFSEIDNRLSEHEIEIKSIKYKVGIPDEEELKKSKTNILIKETIMDNIKLSEEEKARSEFNFNMGITNYNKSEFEEALLYFGQSIKINPNFANAYIKRGFVYNYMNLKDKALEDFNSAIEIDSNNSGAYIGLAKIYSLKDKETADKYFLKALDILPENSELYKYRGDAYNGLEKFTDAIKNYTKSIDMDSNSFESFTNRGYCYFVLENYSQAISDCTEAIYLNPKFDDPYFIRGECYRSLESYSQAISDYSEVINRNPDIESFYILRGNCYCNLEDYTQAISDYSEAININPNFADAFIYLGNCYFSLEDYTQAISDYSEAININPNFADAYMYRGNCYCSLEDYTQAISDYSEAINLNPNFAELYANRGICYFSLEDYSQAREDLEKAVSLGFLGAQELLNKL